MKSEVVIEHFFLGQCVIGQEDKPITVKPLSLTNRSMTLIESPKQRQSQMPLTRKSFHQLFVGS